MTRQVAEVADGAVPVVSVLPGNCQYPWCTHHAFATDSTESVVKASIVVDGEVASGTMHVSHTTLARQYNGGAAEWYDDQDEILLPNSVEVETTVLARPAYSEPMSEPEAIEYARRGYWVTCVTPKRQRNRRYVVAK